ncbi:RNA polymerase sigma factor [Teredinibacter sp. KSP-S5-2]|uniref:RNA polymerase sigma factor n=1 Tax=Teredinibacter sp. KSP-S5-2 TaxID=3034506 RepID=UPI00293446E7|nr:sigma-70 family RNA polymerase sigma factor [Teredinibacter sp. KSP-S5-2]WNO10807.1 sigma-70 family RNA polymerase sigma factor [Teredinibacter sp. KSP-S5-2]
MLEDRSLLGTLFEKYGVDLKKLIAFKFNKSQDDAEEVVQDAFQRVLKLGNISELDNPKAYLYQTAANLALNRIRKINRHREYLANQNPDQSYDLSPERSTTARKDLEKVENSIERLPEKYRRTFLLSRVDGKSYKEISLELNIAESTVEKHIIKALKFLREVLEEGSMNE